jgi:hypothetical protein
MKVGHGGLRDRAGAQAAPRQWAQRAHCRARLCLNQRGRFASPVAQFCRLLQVQASGMPELEGMFLRYKAGAGQGRAAAGRALGGRWGLGPVSRPPPHPPTLPPRPHTSPHRNATLQVLKKMLKSMKKRQPFEGRLQFRPVCRRETKAALGCGCGGCGCGG